MARGEKMYRNSPKMERDVESGKMKVTKPESAAPELNDADQGIPVHVRHAMERQDVAMRHEREHAMVDYGKSGDKGEMLSRHQQEMKEIHKRHMKEMSKGASKSDVANGATKKPEKKKEEAPAEKTDGE